MMKGHNGNLDFMPMQKMMKGHNGNVDFMPMQKMNKQPQWNVDFMQMLYANVEEIESHSVKCELYMYACVEV